MNLSELCLQAPALEKMLRKLVDDAKLKGHAANRLTRKRLTALGVKPGLDDQDLWLERFYAMERSGWLSIKTPESDILEGAWITVTKVQSGPLSDELPDDTYKVFLSTWEARVEALPLTPDFAAWLVQNPPPRLQKMHGDWERVLVTALELKPGRQYSWQQLGANLFNDAKALENQPSLQNWVQGMGEQLRWEPMERGVLLHAHLPAGFPGIALIENQDTYLKLVKAYGHRYGFVFTAGNRGASRNLRDADVSCFGYTAETARGDIERFERYWFNAEKPDFPLIYWGDLDDEGIRIFRRLEAHLPELALWEAAYRSMREIRDRFVAEAPVDPSSANPEDWPKSGFLHQEAVLTLPELPE